MPDWSASMQRTYEYFIVDPNTWREKQRLRNVKSCTITRDLNADTLGSASLEVEDSIGECYVRVYLVTVQNGITERFSLGTFLTQTPDLKFTGKTRSTTIDCYTPLIELKENPPPIGYSILKGANTMDNAYRIVRENVRAPVIRPVSSETLFWDFIADPNEKWFDYTSSLISNAKYQFYLDDMSRIGFAPKQRLESLQPTWTYNDDNSSILRPDITMSRDIFNIPNVVEVIYSSSENVANPEDHYAIAINDDPNSLTSIVSRGRKITHRVTNPTLTGIPSKDQIEEYATQLLEEMSSIECSVTYTHGYCPVRIGDCVRLNYSRADLFGIKAKVISQTINCTPDCLVTEKAVYPMKFWG